MNNVEHIYYCKTKDYCTQPLSLVVAAIFIWLGANIQNYAKRKMIMNEMMYFQWQVKHKYVIQNYQIWYHASTIVIQTTIYIQLIYLKDRSEANIYIPRIISFSLSLKIYMIGERRACIPGIEIRSFLSNSTQGKYFLHQ